MVGDGIGLAEALLGLDGFRVLDVVETAMEVIVTVETTVDFTGCDRCGVRAEAQDRRPVHLRNLPASGDRPGCCGSSAAGVAPTVTVRLGPGRSPLSTSTRRWC